MTRDQEARLLSHAWRMLEDPDEVAEVEGLIARDPEARCYYETARVASGDIESAYHPGGTGIPRPMEIEPMMTSDRYQSHRVWAPRSRRRGRRRKVLIGAGLALTGGLAIATYQALGGPGSLSRGQARPASLVVAAVPDGANSPAPIGEAHPAKADPADPRRLAQAHPIMGTSFMLVDGDHRVPILPGDPINPFAKLDTWFYPVPARVAEREFDPTTRTLKLRLSHAATEVALDRARREIAIAYAAHGKAGVTADQINIQPLPRVGYRLALITEAGEFLLRESRGATNTGASSVMIEIPAERTSLIRQLTLDPNYVTLVTTGYYEFGLSASATIEAQGLRSASLKALETLTGKALTGPVLLDRQGMQKYLEQMRHQIVVTSREAGLPALPMMELALKQQGSLEPMSFREFLDRPGELMTWNAATNRLEAQPETYRRLTTKSSDLLQVEDRIKSLSAAISELATHSLDESKFYDQLKETMDLHAKAKGGVPAVFSADLSFDLNKTYDKLDSGEKKAVSDYRNKASNRSEFERAHLSRRENIFEGERLTSGSNPKGLDLHRVAAEEILGETLFGSHQVKLLDVKTVGISEEITLAVELPSPVGPSLADSSAILARVATLEARFLASEDARRNREGAHQLLQNRLESVELKLVKLAEDLKELPDVGVEKVEFSVAHENQQIFVPNRQLIVLKGSQGSDYVRDLDTKDQKKFGRKILFVIAVPTAGISTLAQGANYFNVVAEGNKVKVDAAGVSGGFTMTATVVYLKDNSK